MKKIAFSIVAMLCTILFADCSGTTTPLPSQQVAQPLAVTPQSLTVAAAAPTAVVNASEASYGGPISESDTCSGIAAVTLGTSASTVGTSGPEGFEQQYSVTRVSVGACTVTLKDTHGQTASVAVTAN
jgi:hypothetical protein